MRLWASPQPLPMKFHGLRHSTNTLLVKANVPDRIIQKVMGHLSKKMTDRYSQIDLIDMRQALTALAPTMKATPNAPREILAPNHCYGTATFLAGSSKAPKAGDFSMSLGALDGAEHRVRTGDLRLGKATLYQLS